MNKILSFAGIAIIIIIVGISWIAYFPQEPSSPLRADSKNCIFVGPEAGYDVLYCNESIILGDNAGKDITVADHDLYIGNTYHKKITDTEFLQLKKLLINK